MAAGGLRRTLLVLIAVVMVIGSNGQLPVDFDLDEFAAGLEEVESFFVQIPAVVQVATSQRCENAEVRLEIERRQEVALEQIKIFRESLNQMQTSLRKFTGYINVGTCQWLNGIPCSADQHMCNSGQCTLTEWVCDGYQDCFDGSDELGCSQKEECSEGEFRCPIENVCIDEARKCDGNPDCSDGSDEAGCYEAGCAENEFRCGDGNCITRRFLCDGDRDCSDGSDEGNCPQPQECNEDEFRCQADNKCILKLWRCDGDQDCSDGSDEADCPQAGCAENEFRCGDGNCIITGYLCDGDRDCSDGSDEGNCTQSACPDTNEFQCRSDGRCIQGSWRCDGDRDCIDDSDEEGCDVFTTTFTPSSTTTDQRVCAATTEFQCRSFRRCIPQSWRCDGEGDCIDDSDEEGCDVFTTTFTPSSTTTDQAGCAENEFRCGDGRCITTRYLCDGDRDCSDGSDEGNCPQSACPDTTEFQCRSDGRCIQGSWRCDGDWDCDDASDEEGCDGFTTTFTPSSTTTDQPPACSDTEFRCRSNGNCINGRWRCDGENDCDDGSDEEDCDVTTTPLTTTYSSSSSTMSSSTSTLSSSTSTLSSSTSTLSSSTSIEPKNCAANQMLCKSSQVCIPITWQCDGVADCDDGTDEEDCQEVTGAPSTVSPTVTGGGYQVGCSQDQFRCNANDMCLPGFWRCDGVPDCVDASDEMNCTSQTTCDSNQFRCHGDGTCIVNSLQCDGIPDCGDSSDEENCQALNLCVGNRCSHGCEVESSSPAGYICTCPDAMMLLRDRRTCVPIWNRGSGPGKGGLKQPLKGSIKG